MSAKVSYVPLSRFVLRTPALPFDVLTGWATLPSTDARRAALRELIADPVVREALYVASPELEAQIAVWQRDPAAPASAAVERALVRYVSRMASRSTPFGLFAALAVGTVGGPGSATRLHVPTRGEATRRTRLDNDFLFALCHAVAGQAQVRERLRYRPNSSLYVAAGRLRYAEARLGERSRTYHLVAVDQTSYLDALLECAAGGATYGDLVATLCADPEVTRADASAFVDEVIASQVLVPELAPAVTGSEPTEVIVELLDARGIGVHAEPLRATLAALKEIDHGPPGAAPDVYGAIATRLADLPAKIEANRLFQVDMYKPGGDAVLGADVTATLLQGVELLRSLTPASSDGRWTRFREQFVARYETREVPLLEALDDESGIGFGHASAGDSSPLIGDLSFAVAMQPEQLEVRPRDAHLLTLVAKALRDGASEIDLTDDDVAKLREGRPVRLPDVLSVMAVAGASSAQATGSDAPWLRILGIGANADLLGRFCHGSAELHELAVRCLRAEEAAHPDAVFAEIIHLPEGRIGNILLRPVLREYEIPYLGVSGAAPERQIAVDDLLVSVVADRVVLRSKRLGKEVRPRLTSAHNFMSGSLPVYHFLCAHAAQDVGGAYWTWGLADHLPYLPRIRRGKIVLDRARWRLGAGDLAPLDAALAGANAAKTIEQARAVHTRIVAAFAALRARLGLPRWIVIGEADNELPVDLDNELMVASAAHLLKGKPGVLLYELFPGPDQLCARGAEGAFAHELLVMFESSAAAARVLEGRPLRPVEPRRVAPADSSPALGPVAQVARVGREGAQRRFLPGSEWLYVKVYGGVATADLLLRDYLAPAIRDALEHGLADRWFFVRYADPDPHLRLRFAGDSRRLTGELLPRLHEALAPATEGGLAWRIVVDTYEREVERYGGVHGIGLAEELFCADSECALAVTCALAGDGGVAAAWRLTLYGIDRLLDDLGLDLAAKHATMSAAREGFAAELGVDTAFQKRLGEKFRAHRVEISQLLEAADASTSHPLAGALLPFTARSRRLRPVVDRFRAVAAAGQLDRSVSSLVNSFVHMHVNRMIRSSQRKHEVVLYDLLRRHYEGVAARRRSCVTSDGSGIEPTSELPGARPDASIGSVPV